MSLKLVMKQTYGGCVGPLGFPMKDGIAKEIDILLKKIPDDIKSAVSTTIDGEEVQGYCRVYQHPKAVHVDLDERTDVSLITTASVDRDNEIVLPNGLDMKQFRRNMVVTFAHIYNALPVGKALWIKREKNDNPNKDGWLAKTKYTSKPETWTGDWFQDAILHMVSEGDLMGKSIGFIPTEIRPPNESDIKTRPELAGVSYIIAKAILLEYAIAPVQSNPDALTTTLSKCKGLPDSILDNFGIILPENTLSLEKLFLEDDEDDKMQKAIEAVSVARKGGDVLRERRVRLVKQLRSSMNSEAKEVVDILRGRL